MFKKRVNGLPLQRVWGTNSADHPCLIEFLRFKVDSLVTGPLRDMPFLANGWMT